MAELRRQKEDAMANKAKASKEEMEKMEKQLVRGRCLCSV